MIIADKNKFKYFEWEFIENFLFKNFQDDETLSCLLSPALLSFKSNFYYDFSHLKKKNQFKLIGVHFHILFDLKKETYTVFYENSPVIRKILSLSILKDISILIHDHYFELGEFRKPYHIPINHSFYIFLKESSLNYLYF